MTARISRFLAEQRPATPCLVVDLDVVAESYRCLAEALPAAEIYYAVKANPEPDVVRLLDGMGSRFDVASIHEIQLCLDQGAAPERLSFGNTIKKQADIAWAHAKGVRLFAFDSEAELEKLAAAAPGAKVYCRLLIDTSGAQWPLSRKFGCSPDMAFDLLIKAKALGLDPYGVSFHVGSQQTDVGQWDMAIGRAMMLFTDLAERGVELRMVNLGGGFPARYRDGIPAMEAYADAIMKAMTRHFGNRLPNIIVEPGRSMVGDAGILQTEVVLISQKSYQDETRWVYLDIGRFGGLAECEGEAIKYRIRTNRDGGATMPVVIAGPTCDSADILYEKSGYCLPVDLKPGDKVELLATGAYTTSYSAVNFNGFPPLKAYCI